MVTEEMNMKIRAKVIGKMKDKQVIEMSSGTSGLSMKQPLIEIHWLLVQWNGYKIDENPTKKEKYAKKVENWFESNRNIPLTSYSTETMKLLNKFDIARDGIIKKMLINR